MRIRELITKLKKFPEDMEVWICDKIEGNDYELELKDIKIDENYSKLDEENNCYVNVEPYDVLYIG